MLSLKACFKALSIHTHEDNKMTNAKPEGPSVFLWHQSKLVHTDLGKFVNVETYSIITKSTNKKVLQWKTEKNFCGCDWFVDQLRLDCNTPI